MVRTIRKVRPTIRLTRESHQVLAVEARTTTKPMIEPDMPKGERAGTSAAWTAVRRRRKEMWAASETIQASIMPNSAPRRMYSKALAGAQRSSTRATMIPYEETRTARVGEPLALRRPSAVGAHPVRASEKIMRDEM